MSRSPYGLTAWPLDLERDVRKHLKKRLAELKGEIRKVNWIMRRGAPDELVMIPDYGIHFFVELKRPGFEPEAHQFREHERMRRAGIRVEILTTREEVDRALMWDLR